MNSNLRLRFIKDLATDLEQVSGARFEQFGALIYTEISPAGTVQSRGVNLEGAAVSGTVDSVAPQTASAAEYTSQKDAFKKPFTKLRSDLRHARKNHPGLKNFFFFSSRSCGPEASEALARHEARFARHGFKLKWFDASSIAEIVVDKIINDSFINRLTSFLPNLQRIREQYALSHQTPQLKAGFTGRKEEVRHITEHLPALKAIAITGMGGIGKTDLACAIVSEIQNNYELTIWVQADEIRQFEDLSDIDVRRNGSHQNLIGLIQLNKALLILDNLNVNIDMEKVASACGPNSSVLVTTQVATTRNFFQLNPLPAGPDEEILNSGLDVACPPTTLALIRQTVGGHPLVLRIINSQIREEGYSWRDIEQDCAIAAEYEDDRRQRVADRILARHISAVRRELAFIAWCDTATIDRGYGLDVMRSLGLSKLEKRSFLAGAPDDVIRIHDIIFAAIRANADQLTNTASGGLDALRSRIAALAPNKGLALFKLASRHRGLVARELQNAANFEPELVFAYILLSEPHTINPRLLPTPEQALGEVLSCQANKRNLRLSVLTDTLETRYRHTRSIQNASKAKEELRASMGVYETLLQADSLSPEQKAFVRHHKGKSHLKLGEVDIARQQFEFILNSPSPLPATKLQLARLYENSPQQAKDLIVQILETAKQSPDAVSASILIETLGTLRRKHLSPFLDEITEKHGDFVSAHIKAAAFCGFNQPFEALAGVAHHWAYKAEHLLRDIFDALPELDIGALKDDQETFLWAEIYQAVGEAYFTDNPDRAKSFYSRARTLFDSIQKPDPYKLRASAVNLLRLNDYSLAQKTLDMVSAGRRDAFWHYRYAQAQHGSGDHDAALSSVDTALIQGGNSKYAASFHALRADIRKTLNHPDWLADLVLAVQKSEPGKYRNQLEARVKRAQAGSDQPS
ncbi:NB-ARC domain-containing protein [Corallococcus interemptor]|uniref:NB-ARC domain-containing protein n=1 Tax=Corallococcus interemptor TaxID=2316720 RepID=UPI003D06C236